MNDITLEEAMKHVTINNNNVFEIEKSDNPEQTDTYRFKIGDGVTPYKDLKYVSTIYSLFPNFKLFDREYKKCVEIKFGDVD